MGNSGWCMSKEVEYQTGEAYRSRNSEFKVNASELDKKEVKMDIDEGNKELKLPVTYSKAQQVRH